MTGIAADTPAVPLGKRLRRAIEAAGVRLAFSLFGALPVDAASAFGGAIARTIGPRLGISRRARHNLARVMPDLDAAAIEAIVAASWENLGRTAAELPHLRAIVADPARVEIVGGENIDLLAGDGRPGIFVTAHLANWELLVPVILATGIDLSVVYRMANNPAAEAAIQRARGGNVGGYMPKGGATARRIMEIMRQGGHVGLLVDQKTNNGIAAPFFGRDAMTTPIVGLCAQRFDCPVVPTQVIRLKGTRFRLVFHPPLDLPRNADGRVDPPGATAAINLKLEEFVRAHPGQWMWMHRRWPD